MQFFSAIVNSAIRYPSYVFGGGSHYIRYVSHLSCDGWESQLLSCSYTPVYYSCTPLGVRCYGKLNFVIH